MKKLFPLLGAGLLALSAVAATIQWFSDRPHIGTLNSSDIVAIERPTPHNILYGTMGELQTFMLNGDGSALVSLNASQLTSGTVNVARLPDLSGIYASASWTNVFVPKVGTLPNTVLAPDANGIASTNYVQTQIGLIPAMDTNGFVPKIGVLPNTVLAPDTNGIASTNYVQSLVGNINRHFYFTATTNTLGIASATNCFTMIDTANAPTATNSIAVPAADVYFLSRITTNTITRIEEGPIDLQTYIFVSGGGGVQSITAHAEIYVWFTNDTLVEIATSGPQVFSESATPTIFSTTMSVLTATNLPPGSRLMLRWKADAVANSPTWNFVIGGVYDSHISLNVNRDTLAVNAGQITGKFGWVEATNGFYGPTYYPTNAGTQAVVFGGMTEYRDFLTNAAFAWNGFSGVSKTNIQTTVYFVTNSTAAYVAMTPPAGMLATNGTWGVTNVTAVTFVNNGGKWTNGIAYPIK